MRARTTSSSRFGSILNGAEMVGVLSILLAGFLLVRSDAITLGAATAAAFYFTRLFSPLMMMLYLLDEAQSAGAALARLIGVTDLPPPAVPAMPPYAGRRLGLADPACGSATRTGRRCCTGST